MKTMAVGDLKTHFSEILKEVIGGEEIMVTFGRKKEPVAVIKPFKKEKKKKRKIGLLEGKASFKILPGFEMTDEEFLGS